MSNLEIQCRLQIARPAAVVFEAIVNPDKMSNYFISKGSGRMEEGQTLMWKFPEFEGSFPVSVGKVVQNRSITYSWDHNHREHEVTFTLEPAGENQTVVTAAETGALNDEAGLTWLKSNTEGWANFLACLKAWLEYGINLRQGAFDFMKDKG